MPIQASEPLITFLTVRITTVAYNYKDPTVQGISIQVIGIQLIKDSRAAWFGWDTCMQRTWAKLLGTATRVCT